MVTEINQKMENNIPPSNDQNVYKKQWKNSTVVKLEVLNANKCNMWNYLELGEVHVFCNSKAKRDFHLCSQIRCHYQNFWDCHWLNHVSPVRCFWKLSNFGELWNPLYSRAFRLLCSVFCLLCPNFHWPTRPVSNDDERHCYYFYLNGRVLFFHTTYLLCATISICILFYCNFWYATHYVTAYFA